MPLSCGSDKEEREPGACSLQEQSGCGEGLVCQEVAGGEPACFCDESLQTGCGEGQACEAVIEGNSGCFTPVTLNGRVFDLSTDAGIEGARVVARDANGAAASGFAITGEDGEYSLPVPTPRNADGTPVSFSVTLRADAAGYLTFPLPPRVALPVDTSKGSGDPPVVESAATAIGLLDLAGEPEFGMVTGKVVADRPWGTLVVAGGSTRAGGAVTAVADRDGTYVVFNVPAGNVAVRGYKTGLQLDEATASVTAGQTTEDVDLHATGDATAAVMGSVQIVNPGLGKNTSVILAVDETFVENAARGEAPPGMRVGDVSGAFLFEGVPDGNYVVLAAFENDFLVRDPDEGIGGTSIVRVTVSGQDVNISQGFKVTGALNVVSPDAEQVVSGTPSFVWEDDSGEASYQVALFDAFGEKVWENLDLPSVSGSKEVTVAYAGPALEPGMIYQYRARSIKQGGTTIAITEDLRGVFLYE